MALHFTRDLVVFGGCALCSFRPSLASQPSLLPPLETTLSRMCACEWGGCGSSTFGERCECAAHSLLSTLPLKTRDAVAQCLSVLSLRARASMAPVLLASILFPFGLCVKWSCSSEEESQDVQTCSSFEEATEAQAAEALRFSRLVLHSMLDGASLAATTGDAPRVEDEEKAAIQLSKSSLWKLLVEATNAFALHRSDLACSFRSVAPPVLDQTLHLAVRFLLAVRGRRGLLLKQRLDQEAVMDVATSSSSSSSSRVSNNGISWTQKQKLRVSIGTEAMTCIVLSLCLRARSLDSKVRLCQCDDCQSSSGAYASSARAVERAASSVQRRLSRFLLSLRFCAVSARTLLPPLSAAFNGASLMTREEHRSGLKEAQECWLLRSPPEAFFAALDLLLLHLLNADAPLLPTAAFAASNEPTAPEASETKTWRGICGDEAFFSREAELTAEAVWRSQGFEQQRSLSVCECGKCKVHGASQPASSGALPGIVASACAVAAFACERLEEGREGRGEDSEEKMRRGCRCTRLQGRQLHVPLLGAFLVLTERVLVEMSMSLREEECRGPIEERGKSSLAEKYASHSALLRQISTPAQLGQAVESIFCKRQRSGALKVRALDGAVDFRPCEAEKGLRAVKAAPAL